MSKKAGGGGAATAKGAKPFNKHQTQGQQNMYNNALPELQANPYVHRFTYMGQQRSAVIQQFPNFGIGGVLWDCELVLAAYLLRTNTTGTEFIGEDGQVIEDPGKTAEPETSKTKGASSKGVASAANSTAFDPTTIHSLANTSFLELGAGTGLAGVAAWLCGGRSVISDLPDVVSAITAPNVSLNTSASSTIHVPDPNAKPAAAAAGGKSKGGSKADETKGGESSAPLYWGDGPADGLPKESMIAKAFQNTNAASVLKRKKSLLALPVSWGVREDCTAARTALQQMLASEQQGSSPNNNSDALPTFDVLLAADVIYHSDQHPILLDTIRTLFGINDAPEDSTTASSPETTKAKKGTQNKPKKQQRLIFVHRKRFSYDDDFLNPLKETLQLVAKTAVKHIVPSYPRENLTIYEFIPRKVPLAPKEGEEASPATL